MYPEWHRYWAPQECAFHLFAEGDDNPGGGGAPPAADPPATRTALGGDPPADGGAPQVPGASEPTNWRQAYAGDDPAALKRAERFATEADFFKSYREMESRLRSGRAMTLPDDATPEEISAFRKAAGVPEKPEDYGLAFSDEMNASDDDKAALLDFAKFMHDHHAPPQWAKVAQAYYEKRMNEARAERAEFEEEATQRAENATLESMAELRAMFPPNELKRNNKIADEFLMKHFGEDQATLDAINMVLDTRLPSGVKVMHYAPFMKGLFAMARAYADDEALLSGDAAGGGKSIDEEFQALIDESVKDSKAFNRDARKVARLNELAAAKERRNARAA